MYSWIFGKYFYEVEIFDMIELIDKRRKEKRIKGLTMSSSFADDLKDIIKGIEVIDEVIEPIKKSSSDSNISYEQSSTSKTYDNKQEENIKMYVENQFKNC